MWQSTEGNKYEIEVRTPEGRGVVVGWGQEKDFEEIAAGLVVVKLEDERTESFKPGEIKEVTTTLVL